MTVMAQGQALVRVGELWRYYKAYEVRTLAKGGWQAAAFDDSGWSVAPSGYVFDDPQIQSRLRTGIHPGYCYLRKKFAATNVEQIRSLVLRVEFEHGFVAYLNGTEIARAPRRGTAREMR